MVLIRLARDEDAAEIAEIYRPFVEGSRISFEEHAPDAAEVARLRREIVAVEPEVPVEARAVERAILAVEVGGRLHDPARHRARARRTCPCSPSS